MINAEMLADYVARETAVVNLLAMREVRREMGVGGAKVRMGPDAGVVRRRDKVHLKGIEFADDATRDDFNYRLFRRLGSDA